MHDTIAVQDASLSRIGIKELLSTLKDIVLFYDHSRILCSAKLILSVR